MDTMKLREAFTSTAIDDCSRFRVLAIYPRRNARNTLLFLDRVIEEMPFSIQRIQTDRGGEFFGESVQRRLMAELCHRPSNRLCDDFIARHRAERRPEKRRYDETRRGLGGLAGLKLANLNVTVKWLGVLIVILLFLEFLERL